MGVRGELRRISILPMAGLEAARRMSVMCSMRGEMIHRLGFVRR